MTIIWRMLSAKTRARIESGSSRLGKYSLAGDNVGDHTHIVHILARSFPMMFGIASSDSAMKQGLCVDSAIAALLIYAMPFTVSNATFILFLRSHRA